MRMKSFCLSAWPSSFLSYALGCGAHRVLTLVIFVFLLELPLRFPFIALADCCSLCLSIGLTTRAPFAQRQEQSRRLAVLFFWPRHTAHSCQERSSTWARSTRQRGFQIHALGFCRRPALCVQTALGVLTFLALPCWCFSQ